MDEQRKAVRIMQEYISDHLNEEIAIEELAKNSMLFSLVCKEAVYQISWNESGSLYQAPKTVEISSETQRREAPDFGCCYEHGIWQRGWVSTCIQT